MTFDPNKTYTIHVWDMPICVVDDETEDYIRNEDGTVKFAFYGSFPEFWNC